MNKLFKYYFLFIVTFVLANTNLVNAQFYNGLDMDFGKNRLQFFEPNWQHMDFEAYNVYFYGTGRPLADFTTLESNKTLKYLENILDYRLRDKVYILVYNTQSEFEQSNIGLEIPNGNQIGGTTRLSGNKLFVYFNGSHDDLRNQIRGGLTEVLVRQMVYGDNWREVLRNQTFLSVPSWYIDGIVSFATENWSVEIDDKLRDLILSGKLDKFNRLTGPDATFAGHALWYYIDEVYGKDVIPNILYMTKISRSVESGFEFVIGRDLPTLIENAGKYFAAKYNRDEHKKVLPQGQELSIRTKKSRIYQRPSISANSDYMAFTTNELGQYKVWLHHLEKGKTKKIAKGNHKLDAIPDESYPLLAWHPNELQLAVIYEKKGLVLLDLYDVASKKWDSRELVRIDKVLSFNYSSDGRRLVISGIKSSQSDLFVYELAQNAMRQVTNDIYDDLSPSFIPNTNKIIFTSNRKSDSVKVKNDATMFMDKKDIFVYDFKEKPKTYTRFLASADFDEEQPYALSEKYFTFLSGNSGIRNRYVGTIDSTISHVDTAIHYRYFTKTFAISNYKRNILYHSFTIQNKQFAEMIKYQGKYRFYLENFKDVKEEQVSKTAYEESLEEQRIKASGTNGTQFTIVSPTEREKNLLESTPEVDPFNYVFNGETPQQTSTGNEGPPKTSKLITLKTPGIAPAKAKKSEVKFPKQENYRLAFIPTAITTSVDFNFANQVYQPFNGGPYVAPGMGTVLKVSVFDLMENHNITGGVRFGLNGNSTEYFLSYTNRTKRLDKTYGFQRQKLDQVSPENLPVETIVNQATLTLSYPFSKVLALKGTVNLRNDQIVNKAVTDETLLQENTNSYWGGLKFELIFDNTREIDVNILNGTRFKLFTESYAENSDGIKDIHVVGGDFRFYTKIHRNIVWANRFAGSTSFGQRKLVYYLGSVDEWITFDSEGRFNTNQNIANDQGYYWQALATNLRGFSQNIRNGNSFLAFNSELRVPIFLYLSRKPLKSELLKSIQLIGFGDIGTAWNGLDPYSDENAFNTRTVSAGGGDFEVRLNNKKDPWVGSMGFGFRAKVFGYYLRLDKAYGIEDGSFIDSMWHLSMGLDF